MAGGMGNLITGYQLDLVEDHHSAGSGRYGLRVEFPNDISGCFPYLNSVLDETQYDHENAILIGTCKGRRFALRRHEIHLGILQDPSQAESIAREVVDIVNSVWRDHGSIAPNFAERKLPPVYDLYKMLPKTNCRKCGYLTCLAFAADLRTGKVSAKQCSLLSKEENSEKRARIIGLLTPEQTHRTPASTEGHFGVADTP